MSYYAQLDDEDKTARDVATISGWTDFCEWARELDDEAEEIQHVADHGWCQHLDALEEQLAKHIPQCEDDSAKSVAEGIVELLSQRNDAETLVITDGTDVEMENE